MLKAKAKKQAILQLNQTVESYTKQTELVEAKSVELYQIRHESIALTIEQCEVYLSALANSPRELNKSIADLKVEFESFESIITTLNQQAHDVAIKSGSRAATGVATGVGIAALAPSAAMAVATTFGTASTGTAIATLSGAAATNAALAWLGGGALAAGGGGVAVGTALLALAGPVGWAIGGSSLVGGAGYARRRNTKIAEEAVENNAEIYEKVLLLERAHAEVSEVITMTNTHRNGVHAQLQHLQRATTKDYSQFTVNDKEQLGALINNVNSLAQLHNRTIEFASTQKSQPIVE